MHAVSLALSSIRQWPLDKQLTLLFPAIVTLVTLLSGVIHHWQPAQNKAALTGAAVFLLMLLAARPALQQKRLAARWEWLLREFWPIPAMLLGYLTMRVFRLELLLDNLQLPLRDHWMLAFDTQLFGQALPLWLEPLVSPLMTLWMESSYLHFYYALPIGSLLWLFWREQYADFVHLRQAVIYTLCSGFVLYFFIPVKGPGDAMPELFSVSLGARDTVMYDAVNSFRYAYDCFPSLHTAIPWVTLLTCWRLYSPAFRPLALFMTLSITLSTLYLRYHYGADVLAGVLLAAVIAMRLNGLSSPGQRRSTALA